MAEGEKVTSEGEKMTIEGENDPLDEGIDQNLLKMHDELIMERGYQKPYLQNHQLDIIHEDSQTHLNFGITNS